MKEGPDIALIAALIGDPARANMLTALMSGKALTTTELSGEAGVTVQTASAHLSKLVAGGLLTPRKQGRHKYFNLANDAVAQLLEGIIGYAAGAGSGVGSGFKPGHMRTRTGPKDAELRKARVCYNHLAGHKGVQLYDSLVMRGFIQCGTRAPKETNTANISLTAAGTGFVQSLGIDTVALSGKKAPMCRTCLDWSERRTHLSGSVGRALLARIEHLNWVKRVPGSRALRFTAEGEREFDDLFAVSGLRYKGTDNQPGFGSLLIGPKPGF